MERLSGKNVWKDGETDFLATEVDRAVANGKLFSITLESGKDGQPPWLTTPVASGGAGLIPLTLVWDDEASHTPGTHCLAPEDQFDYADPTSTYVAAGGRARTWTCTRRR